MRPASVDGTWEKLKDGMLRWIFWKRNFLESSDISLEWIVIAVFKSILESFTTSLSIKLGAVCTIKIVQEHVPVWLQSGAENLGAGG